MEVSSGAGAGRGLGRDEPATYLNCPRCRLSIGRRGRWPEILHCPRCLARSRMLVELFASTLRADQLYGERAPAPGSSTSPSEPTEVSGQRPRGQREAMTEAAREGAGQLDVIADPTAGVMALGVRRLRQRPRSPA
jgi:hypothetical protein